MREGANWSRRWIWLPILMMISIQYVSGLPHPDRLLTVPAGLLGFESDATGLSPIEIHELRRVVLNGLHVPVFALLSLLWCSSLGPWFGGTGRRMRVALSICVPFAILNELSQLWVPNRLAAVHDGVANLFGIALGLALFLAFIRWRSRAQTGGELLP